MQNRESLLKSSAQFQLNNIFIMTQKSAFVLSHSRKTYLPQGRLEINFHLPVEQNMTRKTRAMSFSMNPCLKVKALDPFRIKSSRKWRVITLANYVCFFLSLSFLLALSLFGHLLKCIANKMKLKRLQLWTLVLHFRGGSIVIVSSQAGYVPSEVFITLYFPTVIIMMMVY